jgi:hypothetical protein
MTQTWNDVKTVSQFTQLFYQEMVDLVRNKIAESPTNDASKLRSIVERTLIDNGKRLFLSKLMHLNTDINIQELKHTPLLASVLSHGSNSSPNNDIETSKKSNLPIDPILYASLKSFQLEHPLFASPAEELLFVSENADTLLTIQPDHDDASLWLEIVNQKIKPGYISVEFTDNYKLEIDQIGKTSAIKPMHAHQEQSEIVSIAMHRMGIDVISSSDWRANKMPREKPLCVTAFEYSTIGYDIGRAAFLLIGPTLKEDIRIEIKTQNSPGTAGDKLPTSVRRLKNADRARAYNRAIVGVLGTEYFSAEALEMAREESSPRVMVVEDLEHFNDALEQAIRQIRGIHALEGSLAPPRSPITLITDAPSIESDINTSTT